MATTWHQRHSEDLTTGQRVEAQLKRIEER